VTEYRPLIRLTRDEIMAGLNLALLAELQAVADYDAHARGSDQPDLREALETLRDVEREHAIRLISRINVLGGTPVFEEKESRPVADAPAARLQLDLQGEQWAITEYARLVSGILDDDETAELMTELLIDEIRHAGWLKSTLHALTADE
jgi:bacterioferritin (cytochrome b1)